MFSIITKSAQRFELACSFTHTSQVACAWPGNTEVTFLAFESNCQCHLSATCLIQDRSVPLSALPNNKDLEQANLPA